ncbi:MAG: ABC transporter permease [Phycisphaerales bacterium]|nr:ABC transporter permease [Phycisphaerales bacterium]
MVSLLPGMLQAMGVLAILAVGMTGLGLCLAWPMQSSAGFHAVMMILLMPMWFLSGAVFPMSQSSPWLMSIMLANPLSHGQAALAGVLTGRADLTGSPVGIGMSPCDYCGANTVCSSACFIPCPKAPKGWSGMSTLPPNHSHSNPNANTSAVAPEHQAR